MYSNERADVYFVYGLANGNDVQARRLHLERFPNRRCPNRKTFENIHRYLCDLSTCPITRHHYPDNYLIEFNRILCCKMPPVGYKDILISMCLNKVSDKSDAKTLKKQYLNNK